MASERVDLVHVPLTDEQVQALVRGVTVQITIAADPQATGSDLDTVVVLRPRAGTATAARFRITESTTPKGS